MEQTYRRTIEIDRDRDYHYVRMAPIDHLNQDGSYPFPSEEAALRFAQAHKRVAALHGIDRQIQVWYPDGRAKPIELGLLTNPDTHETLSLFGTIKETRCLNYDATGNESRGPLTSRSLQSDSRR